MPPPPVVIARVSTATLENITRQRLEAATTRLRARMAQEKGRLDFRPDQGGMGTMSDHEERVLQWFAINLLTHKLKDFKVRRVGNLLKR